MPAHQMLPSEFHYIGFSSYFFGGKGSRKPQNRHNPVCDAPQHSLRLRKSGMINQSLGEAPHGADRGLLPNPVDDYHGHPPGLLTGHTPLLSKLLRHGSAF